MSDPTLDALLAVQALDTTADQLRHRRAHLAERADLATCEARLQALAARTAEVRTEREAIADAERKLETEIESVTQKAKSADQKLYSGSVNVPRELTALQDEIDSLQRRQRQLEDQELDLMEQAEPLDATLAELDRERAALDEQASALLAVITEAETVIDRELADVLAQRTATAAPVPAALMKEYEGLRAALGGIGVARLVGNRCDGCHLTLSAVDVDRIRHEPDDALVHCTECERLLVRA